MNFLRMSELSLTDKVVLIREDLNVPIRDGKVTSDARLQASLRTARQRPFAQWLKALGVPPSARNNLAGDWQALAARDAQAWQAEAGIGPGRAAQLSAFFHDPQVLAMSETLRAAGIDGF